MHLKYYQLVSYLSIVIFKFKYCSLEKYKTILSLDNAVGYNDNNKYLNGI